MYVRDYLFVATCKLNCSAFELTWIIDYLNWKHKKNCKLNAIEIIDKKLKKITRWKNKRSAVKSHVVRRITVLSLHTTHTAITFKLIAVAASISKKLKVAMLRKKKKKLEIHILAGG